MGGLGVTSRKRERNKKRGGTENDKRRHGKRKKQEDINKIFSTMFLRCFLCF